MRQDLKVLRVRHNLTQEQMASKLNMTKANYNIVETGKRDGSLKFWATLQNTFNLEDGEVWKLYKNNL